MIPATSTSTGPLSVDQAFQQAATRHKAGDLSGAEQLYRTILQVNPQHPDANHNLGVLAVQVQQPSGALPFLKIALEANPNHQQYWLSYIDALLKAGQPDAARMVIKQGRERGLSRVVLEALERQAAADSSPVLADTQIGTAQGGKGSAQLNRKQRRAAERTTKATANNKSEPPPEKMEQLVTLFNQGRYVEAKLLALEMTNRFPDHGFSWKVLGTVYKLQGNACASLTSMQKASELCLMDADVHSNLGSLLKDLGRLEEAEVSYRRALAIRPDYAEAHSDLGNTLRELGRLEEAEASCRRALAIKPDYAVALLNLGSALKGLGRLDEAEASYRRALMINPDYAKAHSNLGNVLKDSGRLDEAEASYRRALQIKPDYAVVLLNLGSVLTDLGRLDEAEACYRRALQIKPDFAEAHSNLGSTLGCLGRLDEAEACCRQALQIKPDFAEAHSNLGNVLGDFDRLDEAETSYRRALEIKPEYAEALLNLASTLTDMGRLEEAETCYRRALTIKPDFVEAHSNLGNVLGNLGRLEEAEASYRHTLAIRPDYAKARSNLLFTLNYMSDSIPSDCLKEARHFGQMVASKVGQRFSAWNCVPQPSRLRVGLVSGDLRDHPVGFFLENVLAQIDPSRIELFAYSTSTKIDALTDRIKPYFPAWKSLVGKRDETAASLIHADGVHLLLDLSGHTAENRLPVFAWKPAPVQATWLGYFATTGVAEMDYLLGDPYNTPPEEEAHFTETIWRMPETSLCFTPPDTAVEVGPLPAYTAGQVTFGCFNNLTKLNDAVVALWSRILQATPGSRLLIKAKQLGYGTVSETLLSRFEKQGISNDRLLLEKASPRHEYLSSYNRVDIALDPFPFPGGTTSAESLWMGVPVLTKRGDRFISHQGETILTNAGLPDWIADNEDDYLAKAVHHASDLQRLAALRAGLRQQVLASPLFDAARFAKNLETALWGMWEHRLYCLKDEPVDISEQGLHQRNSDTKTTHQLQQAPSQTETNELLQAYNAGHAAEAEQLALALTRTYPHNAFVWKILSATRRQQERTADALLAMQKSAELAPGDAETHSNLGVIFRELGRLAEAEASYRQAIALKPDYAEAYINLGNLLKDLACLEESEATCRKAIALNPNYVEAHCNLGNALCEQGRLAEAEASYRQAITLKSDYAEAYSNLGSVLKDRGCLEGAEDSCRRAIALKPDFALAHTTLLYLQNYVADRNSSLSLEDARNYGRMVAAKVQKRFATWLCATNPGQLRVGIVSGDLRNHPVGYFLEGVLTQLNPKKIELIAYPTSSKADELTARMKHLFAAWRPLIGLSDADAAHLIHTDGVHILIDLAGHTAHNRLPLFAWKPAPVQVTWLGYFATTGVAEMDYLLGDPYNTPAEEAGHFTETIWRLPETSLCFTPPDIAIEVGRLPALSSGLITFGCFNNFTKVNNAVVELWAKVLHAIPESRLFLKTKQFCDTAFCKQVRNLFAGKGIAPDRLQLEGFSTRIEYLKAYNNVDIALDPFPFPGGTTSAESLWMGVPVLTKRGDRFISHQGETIMTNAGLPDWIAIDDADYLNKALQHTADLQRLAALRAGLRQQVLASPLFDAARFAKNLETALWGMWEKTGCVNRRNG